MSSGAAVVILSTEQSLRRCTQTLTAERDFELGDRPEVLINLIRELDSLVSDMQAQLGPEYQLTARQLKSVNPYYKVVGGLKYVLEFLRDIQRSGRGSRARTEETLRLLNKCLQDLKELAKDVGVDVEAHEIGRMRLEQRVTQLESEHPARRRFYALQTALAEAQRSGADLDVRDEILAQLDSLSLALDDHQDSTSNRVFEYSEEVIWAQGDDSETVSQEDKMLVESAAPTIAIITALQEEYAAVQTMIDNGRDYFTSSQKAGEQCYIGEMPAAIDSKHSVVLSFAVSMGTNIAATLAVDLLDHFPTIKTIIIVGIAGGTPNHKNPEEHVRLGDVVVCSEQGVIQYDFVKEEIDEIKYRHPPRQPSARLLHAAKQIEADELRGVRDWVKLIDRAESLKLAKRPSAKSDILCVYTKRKNGRVSKQEVAHPRDKKRVPAEPRVFIRPMASSNTLQKNPFKRDALRDKFGVRAIEMENSGIADAAWVKNVDYFAVRGICDYCDSCKNDKWHGYAAVAAAAYTRTLLQKIPSAPAIMSDNRDTEVKSATSSTRKDTHSANILAGTHEASAKASPNLTDDSAEIQETLKMARRALKILEKKAAGYTTLDIPVPLQIQLEDKRTEVADLKSRLKKFDM